MPEINYEVEVEKFLATHNRYIPTEKNKLLMLEFLENADLDLTNENLSVAFFNLSARGELELKDPEETAPSKPVGYRRREFICYRNGRPISGNVRSL
jgi:hypothetical protein